MTNQLSTFEYSLVVQHLHTDAWRYTSIVCQVHYEPSRIDSLL